MGYCYVIRSKTKGGRPKYLRLTDSLTNPECPWTDDRRQAARYHTRASAESAAICICSTWAMNEASNMAIVRLRPRTKPALGSVIVKWAILSDRGYWAGHDRPGHPTWAQNPVYATLYENKYEALADAEVLLFDRKIVARAVELQVRIVQPILDEKGKPA